MPPELARHAFALAAAVAPTRDDAIAAAIAGLSRGGRSLVPVLAATREAALAEAGDREPETHDVAAPDDLVELAVALIRTRPAAERAVLDLDARHSLDGSQLARVLGLPSADAAPVAAQAWDAASAVLQPAVFARLGAGGCDEAAAVLSDADRSTIGGLLAAGALVSTHAGGCELCADRLRVLVPLRALVSRHPLEKPPGVVATAPRGRRRAEGRTRGAPRGRRGAAVGLAAAMVAAVAGAAGIWLWLDDAPSDPDEGVEIATSAPTLTVSPDRIGGPAQVMLHNDGTEPQDWRAEPAVPWLEVRPSSGQLDPAESVALEVQVTSSAPEGDQRTTIALATSGQAAPAVLRFAAAIERPPEVAAKLTGCTATADVVDESELREVTLNWQGPSSGRVAMAEQETSAYEAVLPAGEHSLVWWVEAIDSRGNHARTAEASTDPAGCKP